MDVLAIAGSLRRDSYNRLLIRAAIENAPRGMQIRTFDDLGDIPLFNEDLEPAAPGSVAQLRRSVRSSDGLLIATPEYNWGIPGVLKNAIDWLSRPPDQVLIAKPVALIGASAGRWGTRLAQAALRQVLTATESSVMPAPAMFVRDAAAAFDGAGRIVDPAVRAQLEQVLAAFAGWLARTGPRV